MGEPAKKERLESESVEQKSAVLIAQVSWCAHAWNVSAQEAAEQIVADLYAHLSNGGSVPVCVKGLDDMECVLEVTARRR